MLTPVLLVCVTSAVVAGAASLVLRLPFAVGVGLLAGIVARSVYEARRQRKSIPWVHVAAEGIPAAATVALVLWLLDAIATA